MKLLIAILLLSTFVSCKIGEKAIAKYKAGPDFPADCSDSFPIKTRTEYFPGKTDTVIDYQYYDSTIILVEKGDTVYGVIQVPTIKTVTIKKVDTVLIVKENTAAVEAERRTVKNITNELIKQDTKVKQQASENKELKKEKRKWFWLFWSVVVAAAVIIFRRPIFGLFAGVLTGGGSNAAGFLAGLLKKKNQS